MYAPIWSRLAANETVTLTCHKDSVLKIKRAIMMEKWRQCTNKTVAEKPSYGRIRFKTESVPGKPNTVRLIATLAYSGSNL